MGLAERIARRSSSLMPGRNRKGHRRGDLTRRAVAITIESLVLAQMTFFGHRGVKTFV